MSQGINGVQTVYTYEASSEYGAIHKVTTTVQANGSIAVSYTHLDVYKRQT